MKIFTKYIKTFFLIVFLFIISNCAQSRPIPSQAMDFESGMQLLAASLADQLERSNIGNVLNKVVINPITQQKQFGLHPTGWTKYDRVVGRNQIPFMREKGTCHEAPKELCC